MPISYGGGIKNEKEIRRIISLGIEKVSVSLCLLAIHTYKDLSQAVVNKVFRSYRCQKR